MKNFLKLSLAASALIALTGPIYATSVLYITDGAGINSLATTNSGTVTIDTSDGDWSIVVGTGISSPPAAGGNPQFPSMTLSITASYDGNGTAGDPLNIYFASDSFGPSSVDFIANLAGHVSIGTALPASYNTWYATGSQLPTMANPIPAGAISLTSSGVISPVGNGLTNAMTGGPVTLASYTLGEDITLSGSGAALGSSYSINASLSTVPEPGISALVLLGIGSWAVASRKTRRN